MKFSDNLVKLRKGKGWSQEDLADKLGISRTNVTNTLRILNLDKRVIELAIEGKLTEGHCRSLLGIENPDKQYEAALRIIEKGQTVRDIERNVKNEKKLTKKNARYEAVYRDIEDSFQEFFGTKVKLTAGTNSGRIVIQYSSNDELERLLELVKNNR